VPERLPTSCRWKGVKQGARRDRELPTSWNVASKHLKYEKTSALSAKSIMLDEEDIRAALQCACRQDLDGAKAG